jgi:LacI family repressor for deo operon, udp, cdd, tsx, nupC, and nupG
MATLSEVARLAGVTTATVSNVLRNTQKVKPATVQKVQEAIAATGYRPNLMARALAEGKSSMVALVLPDINNPFYPEFVRVAERVARHRNYFLMVCNTDERPDIGRAYLRQIAGTLADGVLVLHTGISADDINELKTRRSPIVLASEEKVDLADKIPHVVVNFHRAGEIAGQHLLALGHRNIGVIVGCGLEGMQVGRLQGFRDALAAQGVDLPESRILNVQDNVDGGHDAAMALLDQHPGLTAIFATNDLMAYGASQALADRGVHIPDDISLIGITDIRLARDMRPALTTVALGIEQIATISVNLLLDLIENPAHEPTICHVPDPTLQVRASTGPVSKAL